MKKTSTLLFISLLIGIGLYFGIKNNTKTPTSERLQITASFYPHYFFASEIGKDKVHVTNITPAGAEPHDYELTSGDLVLINSSKLLILNGEVEPWGAKIQTDLKDKDIKILIAGTGLFTQKVTDEEGQTATDPHIWLSPTRAKVQVNAILKELIQIDPSNKDYYSKNTDKLLKDLDGLDGSYKKGLDVCGRKDIVTSHAAFGYLAKDYGFNQLTITGLSPDEEPSLKRLGELADYVKKNGIKYIFFESLVSPKLAQTLAKETGAQAIELNPIEGLTPEEITSGKNYLTVMNNNLQNLRIALECK